MRVNQYSRTVNVPLGMSVKLKVPVDLRIGQGHFPSKDKKVLVKGVERDAVYGFAMENPNIGELTPDPEAISNNELVVIYTPTKNQTNNIHFVTSTGLSNIVTVTTVPVHDHSSIYQGGPAFGTYATAYKKEEEEPLEDNN